MPARTLFFSLSVLVHLSLAGLLGCSVIFLLMNGLTGQSMNLFGVWAHELGTLLEALQMPRRRLFILCILGNAVLLTGFVGLWDARALLRARAGCLVCVTALAAAACILLYVLAVGAVVAFSPFRISVIASAKISFSFMFVGLWNVVCIPISALAHMVTALIHRRLFSPGAEPAAA